MNDHPTAMNTNTTPTFKLTIMALISAEPFVPRMMILVTSTTIKAAGRLMMPRTTSPFAALEVSNGDRMSCGGRYKPNQERNLVKYCDQLIATVAAPTAYSSIRSQPIIHAKSSPMVAYE